MTTEKTGLPIELTRFLRDLLNITTFIETGTGLGRTTRIASELFEQVITIEVSKERWQHALHQFKDTNIACIEGESPQALIYILELYGLENVPIIVFLDAHCSYRAPVNDIRCPLLDELAVIPNQHIIIIDDAHSFIYPHKIAELAYEWPELTEVILALHKRNNPYTFIEGKSIVAVPRKIKAQVQEFLHNKNAPSTV